MRLFRIFRLNYRPAKMALYTRRTAGTLRLHTYKKYNGATFRFLFGARVPGCCCGTDDRSADLRALRFIISLFPPCALSPGAPNFFPCQKREEHTGSTSGLLSRDTVNTYTTRCATCGIYVGLGESKEKHGYELFLPVVPG